MFNPLSVLSFIPGLGWLSGIGGTIAFYVLIGAAVVTGYLVWKHTVQAEALAEANVVRLEATVKQDQIKMNLLQKLSADRNAALEKALASLKVQQAKVSELRAQINGSRFDDRPASEVLKFTVRRLQGLEGVPMLRPVPAPAGTAPAPAATPPASTSAAPFKSTGNPSLDAWIKKKLNRSSNP